MVAAVVVLGPAVAPATVAHGPALALAMVAAVVALGLPVAPAMVAHGPALALATMALAPGDAADHSAMQPQPPKGLPLPQQPPSQAQSQTCATSQLPESRTWEALVLFHMPPANPPAFLP